MIKKQSNIRGLYAITHHDNLSIETLLNDIEAALKGGVRIVQFRDKHSSPEQKQKRALALKTLCDQYQCLFVVNDDIDLCESINADGVHLGTSDTAISAARKRLGSDKIIGATCHNSLELALQAESQGANYIALGRFYSSTTKNEAPLANISCIAPIKKQCTLPIVAIGGITLDNAPALLAQHVQALAVINDLFSHTNIEQRAKQFGELFT